ncbi:MAG TPA: hypothetical protein VMG12_10130 [Polyangiaceae bacterium]|nr:hypothetical protein [Polyangiaceae bacterium]
MVEPRMPRIAMPERPRVERGALPSVAVASEAAPVSHAVAPVPQPIEAALGLLSEILIPAPGGVPAGAGRRANGASVRSRR